MNEPSWNEAIKSAQADMKTPAIRRFYQSAGVVETDGGFAVTLDGRVARTPAKAKLAVASENLAQALAAEWAAQGEILDLAGMPLTRLAHSALDGVAHKRAETIASIAAYAGSDLVCFRADESEALAARQARAFDPVLAFAERALGARFVLAGGIIAAAQPTATLDAVRAAVEAHADPMALTALADLTSLSGSVLIALAVSHGELDAATAWAAAHVDEDFQNERWGRDAEAWARRESRGREFAAAAFVVRALKA